MKTKRILSLLLAFMTVLGIAVSAAPASEASPYKDVKTTRWSYADIMYVTEKGLMNGTEPDKFAPGETMTRAMVVTVLHRLQGAPKMDYKKTFSDVKEGKWYTDAVLWASKEGIVEGKGNGIFAPTETITREQLAAIIQRYAPQEYIITEERADITGYADYKRVHDYARESLAWANAIGLITGKTETTLAPREGATREQFAKILRCFKEYDSYKYELVYNAPTYNEYVKPTYDLVTDADIYVATTGDDNNPGTLDKPVKTFERARDMVRAIDRTGRDKITVAFMAGEYGALDNLAFTAEDAGSAECPIIYTAYGDGEVIFRNGINLPAEDFEPITEEEKALFDEDVADDIYKINLSGKVDKLTEADFVFSGNGVCWEARYPDKKDDGTDAFFKDFTERVEEEGKKDWEYDKLLLKGVVANVANKFTTYEGLKISGALRAGYFVDTFVVKSYDKTTHIAVLDYENSILPNGAIGENNALAAESRGFDDTVFFQNLAEFLDAEGEYWFDSKTKNFYVYKPNGDYSIGELGKFIYIADEAEYLTLRGFEFNCTTDYAIQCRASYTTIEGCVFGNVGGEDVINFTSTQNILVKDCEFYNFVFRGVRIHCYEKGNAADTILRQKLTNSGNLVTNNYFHDYGLNQYVSSGVSLEKDVGAVISHNVFKNASRSGIDYGYNQDLIIEYNVFDNMMMNAEDYGAVYNWHNIGYRDNIVRYNLFTNMNCKNREVYAIYADGSCGQIMYGNLFYNGGAHAVVLNGGRDNVMEDNIVINNPLGDFILYNPGVSKFVDEGTPEKVETDSMWTWLQWQRLYEGTEGYELWIERWPEMYAYHLDLSKIDTDVNCFANVVNYMKNNVSIGSKMEYGPTGDRFGVAENNKDFELTENPYFADPTHGDYTVVKGEEQFGTIYEFDKFGYCK